MAERRSQAFAPIPARAMQDDTLTAVDFRVLAAVAAHDRFGVNGIGCFASHPRLAELAKCHLKSLSRSLRGLAERGYIDAAPHPINKRLRVYHVIYEEADHATLKHRIGSDPVTEESPIGNETTPPIGNKDFQEAEQFQRDTDVNIFRETVRYPAEAVNINSTGVASSGDDAAEKGFEFAQTDREHARFLRKVQAWLRAQNGSIASSEQREDLIRIETDLWEIAEERDHGAKGDFLGGWAYRLIDEVSELIPQHQEATA